ncbi:ABC transporter permease [Herbaspirillum rubrisubalbicans]|uniref:ABC transporter permease n=2 Tax=Herbaspirillum rubrisubalbicans TaxID=80842 RepID=A0AAD0XGE8_9BURK|nr:ABC transporter permease subunit [Herbaspirillum rubrisubalbicans]AYR23614.1 ABC transporter permease [Herbaspirillum rubrisubalbicans]NQE49229.1 ABC transporter permease [Herbaspirillum rubrisubalbicans]QJQ00084.1 ABC transporter permease [Herbaspirillum rubrisubalbicans Os34]
MLLRLISISYGLYLLLPIALVCVGSVGQTWTNTLLPEGFTLSWFVALWQDVSMRRAFFSSLTLALCTCVLSTLLSVPLSYYLYKNGRGAKAVATGLIASMPIAVPTITLAFGYLLVFNSDWLPWQGSFGLLIAAHTMQTMPYLTNTLLSDLRHLKLDQLEQAAATLGASAAQRFFGIVLPNLGHSLISGLAMVSALSIGEFGLSNLLSSFSNRTYPVVLLQAFYGATGLACAATVVLLLLAAMASLISTYFAKR